ncbi:uncharacterized protein LOC125682367 [Ostrea edulis]|uniref:uncharacterized protein LOC125682367 n=1 Tax=Ostrea edulis TaxID=37623 RepID=UPI0020946B87|nr:uncharacterized protein LOC125682367 [Ostrea edulis]
MIRLLFILTCLFVFSPCTESSCFKCGPLPSYERITVTGNADKELICNATKVLKLCARNLNTDNCENEIEVLTEAWSSIYDHYSCTGSSISPSLAIFASLMIINILLYTWRN